MNLSINGARAIPINTSDELLGALDKWGSSDGDFVILEDGEADFIQSAIDPSGYIVEVRDGSTGTMYWAARPMPQPDKKRDRWSRQEALGLISAYFPVRVRRSDAIWEDMHMRTTAKGLRLPRWFYWLVVLLIGLALFVYNDIYAKP
jgi:hypothetical protein